MISKIKIQNFQSHKNTEIDFGKNVNIFIGHSDCGKTAIIRALRWVITNKPGGDAFRSNWGGDTVVELFLENGVKIGRVKGKSRNEYYLQNSKGNILEFKAFGQDVPDEIIKALKFTDVNLQKQLDSPYLLSETPGTIAKHFNKISKLENIDTSISVVQRSIRKLTQDIETSKTNITNLKAEHKELNYLKDFERVVVKLENKETLANNLKSKVLEILKIKKALIRVNNDIEEYSDIIQYEDSVNNILSKMNEYKTIHKKIKSIKAIISQLDEIKESKETNSNLLSYSDSIDKILKMIKEYKDNAKVLNELKNITDRLHKIKRLKESVLKSLKQKEQYYHSNFPDVCPLCGSKNETKNSPDEK